MDIFFINYEDKNCCVLFFIDCLDMGAVTQNLWYLPCWQLHPLTSAPHTLIVAKCLHLAVALDQVLLASLGCLDCGFQKAPEMLQECIQGVLQQPEVEEYKLWATSVSRFWAEGSRSLRGELGTWADTNNSCKELWRHKNPQFGLICSNELDEVGRRL